LKSEVNELKKGKEGGITLFDFNTLMEGDQLEAYELVKAEVAKKTLSLVSKQKFLESYIYIYINIASSHLL